MSALLEQLASDVLVPGLEAIQRNKTEQIITVAVYQRDASRALASKKVSSDVDFNWLSTMRCNHVDGNDGGKVLCKMADASFDYSYEYLGLSERLVQTPLTISAFSP